MISIAAQIMLEKPAAASVAAIRAASHSRLANKSRSLRPDSPGGNAMIRFCRSLAWIGAALAFSVAAAQAQGAYPDRPVKIIVPIGPGGSYDLVGRHFADALSKRAGQSFFVENKPGGRKDMPQAKLQDIVAAAKANPGSISVATAGVGTGQHLVAAAFMKAAGVKLLEVPYKGSPPAFTDLLAGRIDLFFDSVAAGLPYVQSGQAKGIAVLSSRRTPLAPDVPTMSEAGVPGLDVDSWLGIFAPARTPPEVIARLRRDIRASLPDLKERFEKRGGEAWDLPDDRLDAFVATEFQNWTKLIREAGIKLD